MSSELLIGCYLPPHRQLQLLFVQLHPSQVLECQYLTLSWDGFILFGAPKALFTESFSRMVTKLLFMEQCIIVPSAANIDLIITGNSN